MHGLSWDDIRIFIAVLRSGTVAGAARELALVHTTVSRRLAALEDRIGHRLFDRTPDGMSPTAEAATLADVARRMEEAALTVERAVASLGDELSGNVRIATSPVFAELLIPHLDLRAVAPTLEIELVINQAHADLLRREADVALRAVPPGKAPGPPSVVVRRIGQSAFALYGTREYFARRGDAPATLTDLTGHALVGFSSSVPRPPGAELLATLHGPRPQLTANTIPGIARGVRAGFGLGVLPCLMEIIHPELVRVSPPVEHNDLYVAFAEEMQHVPRVRLVADRIRATVEEHAGVLRGEG